MSKRDEPDWSEDDFQDLLIEVGWSCAIAAVIVLILFVCWLNRHPAA